MNNVCHAQEVVLHHVLLLYLSCMCSLAFGLFPPWRAWLWYRTACPAFPLSAAYATSLSIPHTLLSSYFLPSLISPDSASPTKRVDTRSPFTNHHTPCSRSVHLLSFIYPQRCLLKGLISLAPYRATLAHHQLLDLSHRRRLHHQERRSSA